jgi:hypothetical protein
VTKRYFSFLEFGLGVSTYKIARGRLFCHLAEKKKKKLEIVFGSNVRFVFFIFYFSANID